MMNKYNNLPPIVSQSIEALLNPSTPEREKFNHLQTIERIRDGCNSAIAQYNKKKN